MSKESVTMERYAAAACVPEAALCCPVDYNKSLLKAIPQEVIDVDYGCGDPTKYLNPGETVVDLGSGSGKHCFMAAQVVGKEGKVIGVDMTDKMLEVARRNAPVVAKNIGFANVEFRKGRIQDLALNLEKLEANLQANPVSSSAGYLAIEATIRQLRQEDPLIESDSIDVVISNCVLNLVEPEAKKELFKEIFRVLRRGGRAVISDIVSDEPVPAEMQNDPVLWSGCISGALTEEGFLQAFEDAGFYGIHQLKFESKPWRTVNGLEFRSVTLVAYKGKQGQCIERTQAVIYNGPFKEVVDDDNHRLCRGVRMAVCDKTFNIYKRAPYCDFFSFLEPLNYAPLEEGKPFDCSRSCRRHPKETKGQDYTVTTEVEACCPDGICC